jgi:hypothetical protein
VEIIGLRVGDTSNAYIETGGQLLLFLLWFFLHFANKNWNQIFLFKSYLNMWVKYKLRLHFVQIVQLWQLNKYVMRINDLKDFHPSIICYIVAWTNHFLGVRYPFDYYFVQQSKQQIEMLISETISHALS